MWPLCHLNSFVVRGQQSPANTSVILPGLQDEKPNHRPALCAKQSLLAAVYKKKKKLLVCLMAQSLLSSGFHKYLITWELGLFLEGVIYLPAIF